MEEQFKLPDAAQMWVKGEHYYRTFDLDSRKFICWRIDQWHLDGEIEYRWEYDHTESN